MGDNYSRKKGSSAQHLRSQSAESFVGENRRIVVHCARVIWPVHVCTILCLLTERGAFEIASTAVLAGQGRVKMTRLRLCRYQQVVSRVLVPGHRRPSLRRSKVCVALHLFCSK